MSTIEELIEAIEALVTTHNLNKTSNTLANDLKKTFKDKNITIQEWNKLIGIVEQFNTRTNDEYEKILAILNGIKDLLATLIPGGN